MTDFQVNWYDAKKINALANKRGRPSGDDSLFDYVDPEAENLDDHKSFKTLDEAIAFAAEIAAGRDIFGEASVYEIEKVGRRCRYCTCGGQQIVREHRVSAEGVDHTETCNSECCDDE